MSDDGTLGLQENPKARTLPPVGARVSSVDGPGVFAGDKPGTVIEHKSSIWGDVAIVRMDNGELKGCSGISTTGIGWYLCEEIEIPTRDDVRVSMGLHEYE